MTDQRQRFFISWIYEPRALNGGQGWMGKISKGWKSSGVFTAGSGRPLNATVVGDANQDGNSDNDDFQGCGAIPCSARIMPQRICDSRASCTHEKGLSWTSPRNHLT